MRGLRYRLRLGTGDLTALKNELEGQVIAASLHANDKTAFDLEPGVFGVLRNGQLLGFVDNEGTVTFPALNLPWPY